jgi:hypothetical protein
LKIKRKLNIGRCRSVRPLQLHPGTCEDSVFWIFQEALKSLVGNFIAKRKGGLEII